MKNTIEIFTKTGTPEELFLSQYFEAAKKIDAFIEILRLKIF